MPSAPETSRFSREKGRAMQHIINIRRLAALTLTVGAVIAAGTQTAIAAPATAVTRTFSFIGPTNSKTVTLINNVDSLTINARCKNGSPLVFAFSKAPAADIFARVFDGSGRVHVLKNTSFTNKTKGIQLSPSTNDFDSTGSVLFETLTGNVVTVNIAFDNSTTLVKRNLCTVFGSFIAT
jgi:hypothetical protein